MAKRETVIAKNIATLERKIKEISNATAKKALQSKIDRLNRELKGMDMTAKQLANNLLRARKAIKELAKRDFNDLIRRLSKKPEYNFLKSMTREEIVNDIDRKAKPVGWRFKGRGNYKTPTKRQVSQGLKNGTVYWESRPNRSDVSQAVQLKEGGGIPNNYEGKTAQEVWEAWDEEQRLHFLYDHKLRKSAKSYAKKKWEDLWMVQDDVWRHVEAGQYAKGGGIGTKAEYIPNRNVESVKVKISGKSKTIDGNDILNGVYIKTNTAQEDTIYVADLSQKNILQEEIFGQLSDGAWSNARPNDHWKQWVDKTVEINSNKQGRTFYASKSNYNFTGDIVQWVGGRMIIQGAAGKMGIDMSKEHWANLLEYFGPVVKEGFFITSAAELKKVQSKKMPFNEAYKIVSTKLRAEKDKYWTEKAKEIFKNRTKLRKLYEFIIDKGYSRKELIADLTMLKAAFTTWISTGDKMETGGSVETEVIDINELDLPVIRGYFEEEPYEYGGNIEVGSTIVFLHGRDKNEKTGIITREVDKDNWEVSHGIGQSMVKKDNIVRLGKAKKKRRFAIFAEGGRIALADYNPIQKQVKGFSIYDAKDFKTLTPQTTTEIYRHHHSNEGMTLEQYREFCKKHKCDVAFTMTGYHDWKKAEMKACGGKSYGDGGSVDINELDLPVIRGYADDEAYEYGMGGVIGALVAGYVGYKIGRARKQKTGFSTEKKVAQKIKKGAQAAKEAMKKAGEKGEQSVAARAMKKGGAIESATMDTKFKTITFDRETNSKTTEYQSLNDLIKNKWMFEESDLDKLKKGAELEAWGTQSGIVVKPEFEEK
jgi:hypothetical protein